MTEIISGVYKIINAVTGDFYIGSSKDVKKRLACHKCQSTWKNYPNNPMYLDFQKYGTDKFEFQVIAEVEPGSLKETEQQIIEKLQPTYNNRRANGLDVERRKEYYKSEKYKEYQKEYQKEYHKSEKYKEYQKEYYKSDKGKEYKKEYYKSDKDKESLKKAQNKYNNQLCFYNGETLTLCALSKRFQRAGIEHPTIEAKKYLLNSYANQKY